MPVIAEFFGLAGCGKSTLAHAAAQALREMGCNVNEPSHAHQQYGIPRQHVIRLAMGLGYVCRYPGHAMRGLRQLARTRQRSLDDSRAVLCNWLYKVAIVDRFLARPGGKADLCILDEGIVHALWSVCLRGARPLEAGAILDSCPIAGFTWLMVRVDCEPETLRQRLEMRAARTGYRNRLLNDWGPGYESDLSRQLNVISEVAEVLRNQWKKGKVRMLRVHNGREASPDNLARQIAERIKNENGPA